MNHDDEGHEDKGESRGYDVKSRGFGLDKSGICHPERMARFVIALFLAYIWLIYLGVLIIKDKKLDLIVHTDCFMHNLFQLGRLYLNRILEEAWPIPVSGRLPHPFGLILKVRKVTFTRNKLPNWYRGVILRE